MTSKSLALPERSPERGGTGPIGEIGLIIDAEYLELTVEYRAWWLTRCGATVVVQKSAAVQWENAESRLVAVGD